MRTPQDIELIRIFECIISALAGMVVGIWLGIGLKLKSLIHFLTHKFKLTMATFAEVQQALADLQASLDAKQAAIAAAITALEAQIASNAATPEQLQQIIDGLKGVQTDVDSTPTA